MLQKLEAPCAHSISAPLGMAQGATAGAGKKDSVVTSLRYTPYLDSGPPSGRMDATGAGAAAAFASWQRQQDNTPTLFSSRPDAHLPLPPQQQQQQQRHEAQMMGGAVAPAPGPAPSSSPSLSFAGFGSPMVGSPMAITPLSPQPQNVLQHFPGHAHDPATNVTAAKRGPYDGGSRGQGPQHAGGR